MKKRKREVGEERERYRDIERKRWRDKREEYKRIGSKMQRELEREDCRHDIKQRISK